MKDGFIKLAAAMPDIRVGDVEYNLASCIKEAQKYAKLGAKVIAFPELSLTSASCGDMFYNSALLSTAEGALARFASETKALDAILFIGLPVAIGDTVYNCAAAVFEGTVLGLIPSERTSRHFAAQPVTSKDPAFDTIPLKYAGFVPFFGRGQVFDVRAEGTASGVRVAVTVGDSSMCVDSVSFAARTLGADVVVTLAAEADGIGVARARAASVSEEAKRFCIARLYANAGVGESGSEGVCSGHSVIADALGNVNSRASFSNDELVLCVDTEAARAARRKRGDGRASNLAVSYVQECVIKDALSDLPYLSKTPFVPENEEERKEACRLALEIQAQGLAGRFERSHSKTMVVGISGGLDSTLALLVMARAADILKERLGTARDVISAVTMPCFGTTARTKGNAEMLAELLGARVRCIDIKAAVSRHFEDIGHDSENYNVVYENAQARERTQVLMDIANAEGGLVVGTGDLSEAALGWATYNGDHMSMYGVNASVPKTLVRAIVASYADECGDEAVAAVLRDILATPVSPELLPPKDGEIAQCTEGIVGPYELHDFFIYHFVREGTSPQKLLRMAKHAFFGVYDEETVEGWCKVFLHRFVTQQFKRSCTPDAPSVGIVSLSPRGAWQMPSDFSASLMNFDGKK